MGKIIKKEIVETYKLAYVTCLLNFAHVRTCAKLACDKFNINFVHSKYAVRLNKRNKSDGTKNLYYIFNELFKFRYIVKSIFLADDPLDNFNVILISN